MTARIWLALPLAGAILIPPLVATSTTACCPVMKSGKAVVNADQTVLIIWDAAAKTQHFIRRASFKSEADDFGFLVPSPSKPELEEAGNEAFPYLMKLTEPEHKKMKRPGGGMGCGCSGDVKHAAMRENALPGVVVHAEKEVAGFQAVVLEAKSANDLVAWLKDHGYAFSPEVEAWAKPYVAAGWMITAFKVAKNTDDQKQKDVAASALRMSFKTDKPLFPYREPDFKSAAQTLGATKRLLRIYFVAEGRYRGALTPETEWTGKVAWADHLSADNRKKALELLKLPETTGPAEWYLTEFEDDWPYRVAPADVVFSRDQNQTSVKRPPIIDYVSSPSPTDVMVYAFAGIVIVPSLLRLVRRRGISIK